MKRQTVTPVGIIAVLTLAIIFALTCFKLSSLQGNGRRFLVDLPQAGSLDESSEDLGENKDSGNSDENKSTQCEGRRVFIVDLGEQFHRDLLTKVQMPDKWHQRATSLNGGFGPQREFTQKVGSRREALAVPNSDSTSSAADAKANFGDEGDSAASAGQNPSNEPGQSWPDLPSTWFDTWANSLDVMFHRRMLTNPCLVDSADSADLFFVLYYGSLDISAHIGEDNDHRGQLGKAISEKLLQSSTYRRQQGKDHFVVVGRPYWDFISNLSDPAAGWGSGVLREEAFTNVQIVTVERPFWVKNTIGAPYPMAFHPPGKKEIEEWVAFVQGQERPWLFVFAGARRKVLKQHKIERAVQMRNSVFSQCEQSSKCKLIDCENPHGQCEHDWRIFTQLYLSATFCVHPRGDSCTRRAVLDSMLAGCIPVVLEECSLQWQLDWLLGPVDQFSVFVDGDVLRHEGQESTQGVMLEDVLARIEKQRVEEMRSKVIQLISKITYGGSVEGNTSIKAPDFGDAFTSVIEKVRQNVIENLKA